MQRVTTTQEEERFTRKQGSKCSEKTEKPNHWATRARESPTPLTFFGIERRLPVRTLTFSPSHGGPGYLMTKILICRERRCLKMKIIPGRTTLSVANLPICHIYGLISIVALPQIRAKLLGRICKILEKAQSLAENNRLQRCTYANIVKRGCTRK